MDYEQRQPESQNRIPKKPAASKHRPKRKQSPVPMMLFIVGALVLAGLVALLMILLFGGSAPQPDETRDGIAYLEALEKKSPDAVADTIAAQNKERLMAQWNNELNEKEIWYFFEDYAILGDSRAWGFAEFNYLDRNRILAAGGDNIRMIMTHLEELKALRPSYIFLCYGMNDMGIGYWDTAEDYIAEYMQIVADLQAELPNSKIFISSILPAHEAAFQRASIWREIPAYNEKLRQTCEEQNVLFVDNDQISADHANLWDDDGIHVRREFYQYWGRNMILAIYEEESHE